VCVYGTREESGTLHRVRLFSCTPPYPRLLYQKGPGPSRLQESSGTQGRGAVVDF
jgi:hypothetical protein